MNNPIHELEEPEMCNNCNGDGCESKMPCTVCNGEGGWAEGWYFWCEAQVDRYGPYESEEEANKKLKNMRNSYENN